MQNTDEEDVSGAVFSAGERCSRLVRTLGVSIFKIFYIHMNLCKTPKERKEAEKHHWSPLRPAARSFSHKTFHTEIFYNQSVLF